MNAHGTQQGLLSNGTARVCIPPNHFDREINQERLYFESNQEALANESEWIQAYISSNSIGSGITARLNKIANGHGGSWEPLLVKGIDLVVVHGCHCGTLVDCIILVTTLSIALSRISLSRFLFLYFLSDIVAVRIAVLTRESFGARVKFAFVVWTHATPTWVGASIALVCRVTTVPAEGLLDSSSKPSRQSMQGRCHIQCTLVCPLFPHRTSVLRASLASASAIDRRGAGVIRSTFVSTILCVAIIAG